MTSQQKLAEHLIEFADKTNRIVRISGNDIGISQDYISLNSLIYDENEGTTVSNYLGTIYFLYKNTDGETELCQDDDDCDCEKCANFNHELRNGGNELLNLLNKNKIIQNIEKLEKNKIRQQETFNYLMEEFLCYSIEQREFEEDGDYNMKNTFAKDIITSIKEEIQYSHSQLTGEDVEGLYYNIFKKEGDTTNPTAKIMDEYINQFLWMDDDYKPIDEKNAEVVNDKQSYFIYNTFYNIGFI
tara:strand:+ start:177 stop:905 length:729 start_codon:yes stop_codon:yes gene_type:complete